MGDQNWTHFHRHTTYNNQKQINHHTIGGKMLSVTKLVTIKKNLVTTQLAMECFQLPSLR